MHTTLPTSTRVPYPSLLTEQGNEREAAVPVLDCVHVDVEPGVRGAPPHRLGALPTRDKRDEVGTFSTNSKLRSTFNLFFNYTSFWFNL